MQQRQSSALHGAQEMAGVTGTSRQVQQHELEMDQAQDLFSARRQSGAQDWFHLGHP